MKATLKPWPKPSQNLAIAAFPPNISLTIWSKRAVNPINIDSSVLLIGIGATDYGREASRTLEFARVCGAATNGNAGLLASPINRTADLIVYAPTDVAGPLPSIVALVAALTALVQVAAKDSAASVDRHLELQRQNQSSAQEVGHYRHGKSGAHP